MPVMMIISPRTISSIMLPIEFMKRSWLFERCLYTDCKQPMKLLKHGLCRAVKLIGAVLQNNTNSRFPLPFAATMEPNGAS